MLKIGLTGGLACGKSTVGKWMQQSGAHLLLADDLAHELMSPGEPVYAEVVSHFGRDILKPDSTIDRERLASLAFGAGRVPELNSIVHPAVVAAQAHWFHEIEKKDPKAIAVVEAALIFEAGIQFQFDQIVVVTCPEKTRIERYVKKVAPQGGPAAEAARKDAAGRIAAQWPDARKAEAADYILDNSGTPELTNAQVERLMEKLRVLAAR